MPLTREEAIAQGVQGAKLVGEAIRAIEASTPSARLTRLHTFAAVLGREFEDLLGLAPGTVVPLDGDPVKGP